MMNLGKTAIALTVSSLSVSAFGLSPSVGDPGFSGHVDLGAQGGRAESNFVAEFFGSDISDDQLKNLGEPDDKGLGLPVAGYDFGWTFSNGKTRLFIANDTHDEVLNWDGRAELALRHDTDSAGNFQLSGLISSGQTKVYRNPYQLGKRDDTEYTNSGARFVWDKMFNTQLELRVDATQPDVDEERSGASLSSSDQQLLKRDGDIYVASLGYLFDLGRGYSLRPAIGYIDHDLDGKAMANKGGVVELAYGFDGDAFRLGLSGSYADLDGDEVNPIFGDKNDVKSYTVTGVIDFPGLFGWEHWVPSVRALYAKDDSDIDFNTEEAWTVGVSFFRAF